MRQKHLGSLALVVLLAATWNLPAGAQNAELSEDQMRGFLLRAKVVKSRSAGGGRIALQAKWLRRPLGPVSDSSQSAGFWAPM